MTTEILFLGDRIETFTGRAISVETKQLIADNLNISLPVLEKCFSVSDINKETSITTSFPPKEPYKKDKDLSNYTLTKNEEISFFAGITIRQTGE